ncbi:hypothetical protein [Sorangium sp. So ce590]|uniref:hypothetical protein n=1 Tax=unclassified Sorangium TaxID=2621164 RepID=UPI003F5FA768
MSITSAAVAASGCVAPEDDEPLASVAQPAVDAGERQESPVYVKNWPTTDGRRGHRAPDRRRARSHVVHEDDPGV